MAKSAARTNKATGRSARRVVLWAALVTVALALAGAGSWVGARAAWQAALTCPQFQLSPLQFNLSESPPWVNGPRMAEELRRTLGDVTAGKTIFDPDITHAVQHELQGSPWLLDTIEVRRKLPNSLLVKAAFRKPAGLALWNNRTYVIDRDGHMLPDHLFRLPSAWEVEQTPATVDRFLDVPPNAGQRWDGPRLAAGARLTEFYRRLKLLEKLHVMTIDVSGVGRAALVPDIVLRTAGGAQVKWGKSSVYENIPGLELPPTTTPDVEKLQMLLSKLNDYPGLRGVRYVDLRFHGKIYFQTED